MKEHDSPKSAMITLSLDTSVLRAENIVRGPRFQLLRSLIESGEVQLCLSKIVYQEFLSAKQQELIESLGLAKAALSKNRTYLNADHSSQMSAAHALTSGVLASCAEDVRLTLENWVEDLSIELLAVEENHAEQVFQSYFSGSPPFQKIKSREDIPDAFIIEALRTLAENAESLAFVTYDKRLRDAAAQIEDTVVYNSLDGFLSSPEIRPFVVNHVIENRIEQIKEMLSADQEFFDKCAAAVGSALLDRSVRLDDPDSVDERAVVTAIEGVSFEDLSVAKTEYMGENILLLPFRARVDTTVSYHIFAPSSRYANNDDFVLTEDVHPLLVDGEFTITLHFHHLDELAGDFDPNVEIDSWAVEASSVEFFRSPKEEFDDLDME